MNIEIPDYGRILVGLSGGADSVALLRLLHGEGADMEALHCNFQLRGPESERDEQFVTALCQQLDVTLHTQRFDTRAYAQAHGISTEMAARQLRYEWFEKMRQERRAAYIAVAHHRDDQAETVLLNLIRGTGLRGLAGMRSQRDHVIRPLLRYSREDIMDYLGRIGQDYVTDSTNLERDALRNRIRLDVMPLLRTINPQATAHIAEAAERVADAIPYYLRGVDAADHISPATLHERLLGLGFTPAQEKDILQALQRRSGAVFESHTHRLLCNRGHLIVEDKATQSDAHPPRLTQTLHHAVGDALGFIAQQPRTPNHAYLDAGKVIGELTLRHPCVGDRFRPFGMTRGTRLVSDFLTDRKRSLFEKQRQWLLCDGERIVWVVGLRIDQRYAVTASTTDILALQCSMADSPETIL